MTYEKAGEPESSVTLFGFEGAGKHAQGICTFSSVGRATDSYSVGPRFESVKVHHGPLVKWLRQRPLTPLTSVRIRYGSPDFSRAKVLDKGSEIQYNTVCSPARPDDIELVLIRARVHPFPFRTRQLSSFLLTILGWRRPGKIGSANTGSCF